MRRIEITTSDILRARGSTSRWVIARDLAAGLFRDCPPRRTSRGYWSVVGVFYLWPHAALRRASYIGRAIRRRATRAQIAAALARAVEGDAVEGDAEVEGLEVDVEGEP